MVMIERRFFFFLSPVYISPRSPILTLSLTKNIFVPVSWVLVITAYDLGEVWIVWPKSKQTKTVNKKQNKYDYKYNFPNKNSLLSLERILYNPSHP